MDQASSSDPTAAAYERALAVLLGRINYERSSAIPYRSRDFRLDRMRDLLGRLGNPHEKLKIVHIAGTKGKGSTAAMIAAVLRAAGYRVGLYTSPHLERLEERFVVDGRPCSPGELVELTDTVLPAVIALDEVAAQDGGRGPTFFEMTTAMAFTWFAQQVVDVAVVEVGLGGRLDSTNVCVPQVSVITSISLDHTKQLGTTPAAIAREKAGIIKPGVPIVSGVTVPSARDAIAAIAEHRQAPLKELERDFGYQRIARTNASAHSAAPRGPRIKYWENTPQGIHQLADLSLGLLGEHQARNAATAIATLRELERQGWRIPESALADGLANVRCAARMELVSRCPDVVLDVAHNEASIAAFLATLDECFAPRRRILLFAASQDKDVGQMLRMLVPRFDVVVLTRYCKNPRAVSPEVLQALVHRGADQHERLAPLVVETTSDPEAGWQVARQHAGPDDLVCITGSFFLAAELRSLLARAIAAPPVPVA